MRKLLPLVAVVSSLTLSAAASAQTGAPDEGLGPDISQIVGLAQDDPTALLPFGKKMSTTARAATAGVQNTAATPPAPAPDVRTVGGVPMSVSATSIAPLVTKLAMPAMLFVALLGGLLLIARKKAPGRHVRVMEMTTLGKGRSVVVADVAGKTVLLGVSEGGVTLLMDELPITSPSTVVDARAPTFFERFFNRAPAPSPFDAQLYDSTDEDDELRRKIAAHLSGSQPVASAAGGISGRIH
jgi:flagellar biogenesis protein FliO